MSNGKLDRKDLVMNLRHFARDLKRRDNLNYNADAMVMAADEIVRLTADVFALTKDRDQWAKDAAENYKELASERVMVGVLRKALESVVDHKFVEPETPRDWDHDEDLYMGQVKDIARIALTETEDTQ